MRLAFVFIAEAYQAYHLAAVALELRRRKGVSVDVYYNDPRFPLHFERIVRAYGEESWEPIRLRRDWLARLIQAPRLLGVAKTQVLEANRSVLLDYDMLVFSERFGAYLREGKQCGPAKLAYVIHGTAGRRIRGEHLARGFDLILTPGEADTRRYKALGCLRDGGYRATGYPKIETVERLKSSNPKLFSSDRPIVLYNPHKIRTQSSWRSCIEPLLEIFRQQNEFNLIAAPHIKLFSRRSERIRNRWRARSTEHILIDPGSERCLDNSYTALADIYVGDVSSQVSEFMMTPRPCVFLNPHRIQWRGNPYFQFWEMGEVIEDINDLMPALRRAHAMHSKFIEAQRSYVAERIRPLTESSVKFTADSLLEYLHNGRIEP